VLKTAGWLPFMGLALGACATAPAETSGPQMTTGQALAQIACPHRIAEAHAWVNHMPGPNRAAQTLSVDIKLVEPTDTAIILKSPASKGDMLILEIRTSPNAPAPGRLSYREPVPDPLPKKISFFCRGGEISALTTIEQVY
jgi:hypothetical protein